MYCSDCLKCVIIKTHSGGRIHYCEVILKECKDDFTECNRKLLRSRLNTFSTENNG